MKVNGSDPLSRLREMLGKIEETERSSRAKSSERSGQSSDVTSTDSVEVSPRAVEMRRLREEIETSPEVRQELVDQLKDEISSGRYRIDGTKIADSMLSEFDS